MKWVLDRLKEANTWRGMILIATACGLKLDPEQSEAIIAGGLALVGLINVFSKQPVEVRKALPVTDEDRAREIGKRGNPAK